MLKGVVSMSLGGGGKQTNDFIKDIIFRNFSNDIITYAGDAAHIEVAAPQSFTTDSFIVQPEFFNGGNIGKLAVCGTVNDLAVSGAVPIYLSFAIVVSEGYELEKLEKIVIAAAETSKTAGVQIVCGDTKVVERASFNGIILNTAGVGHTVRNLNDYSAIKAGDCVIVSSDIARHGMSIMASRGDFGLTSAIESDCAPLNKMLEAIYPLNVKFCRDATRGGLAAVLNEIAGMSECGFEIDESKIPISENVAGLCEILGFDPLTVANEGLCVIVAASSDCDKVLNVLRSYPCGKNAACIGRTTENGNVVLKTIAGGSRFIDMPPGELLPRIC